MKGRDRGETSYEKKTIKKPSSINIEQYKNIKNETNKVLRSEKRLVGKKIEKNKNDPRRFFIKSASIKRGYIPQTTILRNDLGDLVTKEESVVEELKKKFESLLNKIPSISLYEETDIQQCDETIYCN